MVIDFFPIPVARFFQELAPSSFMLQLIFRLLITNVMQISKHEHLTAFQCVPVNIHSCPFSLKDWVDKSFWMAQKALWLFALR